MESQPPDAPPDSKPLPGTVGARSYLSSPLLAVRALTAVGGAEMEAALQRSAIYFPLVGLLIGTLWVATDKAASVGGKWLASLLVLTAGLLVTGGRPLLALGRVTRALFAGRSGAITALQAPASVGLYVAAVVFGGLELACLVGLDRFRLIGLLVVPVLGRCSMVVLAVGSRAATGDGRRVKFAPGLSFNEFALASTMTFAVIAIATEFLGLLLVLCTASLTVALRVLFHRWIGGIDRTAVDATCEATQIATLALLASFS